MKYRYSGNGDWATIVVVLLFAALYLAFVPMLFIWAVNMMFSLSIAYTGWSWVGAAVLLLMFGPKYVRTDK